MEIKTIILFLTAIVSLYYIIFWILLLLEKPPKEKKIKFEKLPLVSIIIPAYNEEKTIASTIESVLNLDYPKNKLQIIVVNDGSIDNTKQIVKKIVKKYKNILLINQKNKGKASAMNHGLKYVKGKFFVSLDSDSFVSRDALKNMLPYFSEEDVGSVTASLKTKDPKTFIEKIQWFEYLVNTFYKKLMSYLDCILVTPGPFSVYRTNVIKKLGGFDENKNLVEDFEMALKLQKAHYRIALALEADVYTVPPKTFYGLYRQRNRWYKGSIFNVLNKRYRTLLFNKKYGDFAFIQLPIVILAGVVSVVMVSILSYDLFKGLYHFIKNLALINFDIIFILKSFITNFNFLAFNYNRLVLLIILILLTILILTYTHRYTREPIFKLGKVAGATTLVLYTFLYFMILGIIWIGISFDLLLGRRQKW